MTHHAGLQRGGPALQWAAALLPLKVHDLGAAFLQGRLSLLLERRFASGML